MKRRMQVIGAALLGTTLGLGSGLSQASAQNAVYKSSDATYCDIYRAVSKVIPRECATAADLSESANSLNGQLTRGITRRNVKRLIQKTAVVQKSPPKHLSVALKVLFKFDSAELTSESKRILDRVARVFKDDLMTDSYIQIEGHADATGAADYNQELSTRRANAVRDYLVKHHKIDPNRLLARGKGESEPYYPGNPYSAINRRVEFHNITG